MEAITRLLEKIQQRLNELERLRAISKLVVPKASSDPSGTNGQIYYNTATHKFKGYANGSWVDLH